MAAVATHAKPLTRGVQRGEGRRGPVDSTTRTTSRLFPCPAKHRSCFSKGPHSLAWGTRMFFRTPPCPPQASPSHQSPPPITQQCLPGATHLSLVQRCMRSPMLMTYALGMYGTVAQSSPFGSTCPPNKINQNKKQVANGNNQKQHVLTCVGGRTSRDMYRWLQLHWGRGCPRASKSVLYSMFVGIPCALVKLHGMRL